MSETLREVRALALAAQDSTYPAYDLARRVLRVIDERSATAAAPTPDESCVHCGTVSALVTCPDHAAPTPDEVGLRPRRANLRCDRCSDNERGLGSSALCICGPNVPCWWCGQGVPTPDEVGQVEGLARVGTLAQLGERRALWGTTLSFEEHGDLHEAHERDSWRGEFTEVPTTVERILAKRGATGSDA